MGSSPFTRTREWLKSPWDLEAILFSISRRRHEGRMSGQPHQSGLPHFHVRSGRTGRTALSDQDDAAYDQYCGKYFLP